MDKFEEWFASQYFYTNMRFVHGDALFDKDGDFFRILAVQIAWEAWQFRQAEINQLQSQINEMAEVGLNQESVIREKDKKLKSVEQILIELKESMTNFKEMDLYDKGVRVVTDCIIRDLEKAIRGEHE